jgi:hypothetical protein
MVSDSGITLQANAAFIYNGIEFTYVMIDWHQPVEVLHGINEMSSHSSNSL